MPTNLPMEGMIEDPAIEKALLDTLSKDFKRLQQQKCKQHGGVEGRTLLNIAMSEGEHHVEYKNKALSVEAQEENKLYLKFNLIGRRVGKLLGRLSAMEGEYVAIPDKKTPKAFAEADVVEKVDRALDEKINQQARQWEVLYWLTHGGVAFVHTPWVPNVTMEPIPQYNEQNELLFEHVVSGSIIPQSHMEAMVESGQAAREHFEVHEIIDVAGDVGCEVFGPLNVFVDQGVKSIAELAPDQWVYVASIRTMGWIEDNYDVTIEGDKELSIVTSRFIQTGDTTGGRYLQDLIPLIQGQVGDDDPPMCVVVHGYQCQSKKNPRGKYVCFVPGKAILANTELPYEEIPLVDFHWKPVTTSFWTGDYISDLIPPQRFLNKRVSQLGEQSNASLYSIILLGGSLTEKDIIPDKPSVVKNALAENGMPLVQRLTPPELGTWFLPSLELVMKMFNDIAGGMDLTEDSKFPGQMRGPLAVPMMQEIMDTEWGPVYNHLGERWSRVKQQRLNRIKQFYPPVRTMHYTDRNMKDEVLTFHKNEILKAGTNFNITVKRGSLLPELRSLREDRVIRQLTSPLAILYMDERSGKYDRSKIAQELKYGDTGREDREQQYRKLGQDIVEMLWSGQPLPPVMPFYDHAVMMDELEAAMATTEWLRASPMTIQAFSNRWEEHRQYMIQEAQAQQQSMNNQFIQTAVAQATQQAAAQAAADAVVSTQQQMSIQKGMERNGETAELVRVAANASRSSAGPQRPAAPSRQGGR